MDETSGPETSEASEQSSGLNRRRLLQTAATVGVGAAVWTEPSIKGLARTPAFAVGSLPGIGLEENELQWNRSANKFGWPGQPCVGDNPSPYTVAAFGGSSVCAGAWGFCEVILTGDGDLNEVTIETTTTGCYIDKALAGTTAGLICETNDPAEKPTTLVLDTSCVGSQNVRLYITVIKE